MTKGTNALLITENGAIRPVLIDEVDDISRYLCCEMFDVCRLPKNLDVFVSDTGLVDGRRINVLVSALATEYTGISRALFGHALLVGTDGNGGTVDLPEWASEAIRLQVRLAQAIRAESLKKEDSDGTAKES